MQVLKSRNKNNGDNLQRDFYNRPISRTPSHEWKRQKPSSLVGKRDNEYNKHRCVYVSSSDRRTNNRKVVTWFGVGVEEHAADLQRTRPFEPGFKNRPEKQETPH